MYQQLVTLNTVRFRLEHLLTVGPHTVKWTMNIIERVSGFVQVLEILIITMVHGKNRNMFLRRVGLELEFLFTLPQDRRRINDSLLTILDETQQKDMLYHIFRLSYM